MDGEIELSFSGPYSWLDDSPVPCLYEAEERGRPGLYLWAAEAPQGFLVSYVGETGRTVAERLTEHLKEQLCGMYALPDPDEFAAGKRASLLWKGMYGRDREEGIGRFASRLLEFAPKLDSFIRSVRLFVAPFDGDDPTRRCIEAALADSFYEQAGLVGEFIEPGIRYDRSGIPVGMTVRFTSQRPIVGLPERLSIKGVARS